ncbi:PAS domain S-box protein [Desulfosporosinus fructosivorans]
MYDFLTNVIVVLFLCGVIIRIDMSIQKKYSYHILGVLFGLITIFVMTDKIMITDGRFFDFRHITMTMAGFIGGPVTAVIAAIISSIHRYNVGGSGSIGGIANIIVFAFFGSMLGMRSKSGQNGKKVLFWFIVGIVMALILIIIVSINSLLLNDSEKVLGTVAGPLLILTPIATTVIFNYYFWIYEFLGKASMLNTILSYSPLNLMIFDTDGPIIISENLKKERQFSPYIENPALFSFDNICRNQQHREIITEDGWHFVADLSSFLMPNGKSACIAIVKDATDEKRDQEKLRVAIERFSKAFQLGPHMMSIIRKSDHKYVDANRRFLETKGFTRENVIGKTPTEIGVPISEWEEIIKTLEEQGSVHNIEGSLVTKDGSVATIILSAERIQINDQECILLAYNDITEMKRMQTDRVEQLTKYLTLEADLSRSNQFIADIINTMPDAFYVLDDQWRFTFLNKKSEQLLLKTREELLYKDFWQEMPGARGTLFELNYQKARNDCVPITFESLGFVHKNTCYQVTAYPSQLGLSVYYKDITERKLASERLMESQKQKNSILESMTDCFLAIDKDWQVTFINRAAEKALGKTRDELLGKKMPDIIKLNDISLQKFNEVINERKSVNYESLSKTLGNTWLEISAYPTETGLTCYFRDITSRKKADSEIARLDRLNLVGQLAAGIGHEIRNPMTTVRGYLQLLGEKPDYAAQKSTFELMISELDRANSIITEFLSLAQTKQAELKSLNLNDILNNLYPLLEADTFTQNKQISFIPGKIPNLELNGKEITQLVLNIIRNGLEAMAERGCLTVRSYVEENQVVLTIEDEGCGIPPEDLKKVGTPFFTTKDNGTGLGLATCYKIAESHNAEIQIGSSSSGTTFFIIFPIPKKEKEQNEMIA